MKRINLTFSFRSLNQLVIALFLFASPLAGAYAACCAGHGGVASCNKSTGHQMCKDGTASPSCMCTAPKKATKAKPAVTVPATKTTTTTKSKAVKAAPATTTETTAPAATQKNKPKSSWWGGKSTTTTTTKSAPATKSTTNSGTSAKGCCSRHGGVASCDKASGHQMCKDGTPSPSCACN